MRIKVISQVQNAPWSCSSIARSRVSKDAPNPAPVFNFSKSGDQANFIFWQKLRTQGFNILQNPEPVQYQGQDEKTFLALVEFQGEKPNIFEFVNRREMQDFTEAVRQVANRYFKDDGKLCPGCEWAIFDDEAADPAEEIVVSNGERWHRRWHRRCLEEDNRIESAQAEEDMRTDPQEELPSDLAATRGHVKTSQDSNRLNKLKELYRDRARSERKNRYTQPIDSDNSSSLQGEKYQNEFQPERYAPIMPYHEDEIQTGDLLPISPHVATPSDSSSKIGNYQDNQPHLRLVAEWIKNGVDDYRNLEDLGVVYEGELTGKKWPPSGHGFGGYTTPSKVLDLLGWFKNGGLIKDLELMFDLEKAKVIAEKTLIELGITKKETDTIPLDHDDFFDDERVAKSLWQMRRFSGVKTATVSDNVIPVSEIVGTQATGTTDQIDKDMHAKGYFMFREHYPWGKTLSYQNKQGDKVYLNIKWNEDELKPGIATWVTWDQLVEILKQEWRPASQEDRQWYLEHLIDRPIKGGAVSRTKTLPTRTALIKGDGIADGGEPYTDDEMDLMEGKLNPHAPAKEDPKRWAVRVTFDDGEVNGATINGTQDEIRRYYLDNDFTLSDEVTTHRGIKVDFVKCLGEAPWPYWGESRRPASDREASSNQSLWQMKKAQEGMLLQAEGTDNHGQIFTATLKFQENPIIVFQEKSGKTAGKWTYYLSSLTQDKPGGFNDSLIIDLGQNWTLKGLNRILTEAVKVVQQHKQ